MGYYNKRTGKNEILKNEIKPDNTFEEVDLATINPELQIFTKDIKIFFELLTINETLTKWQTLSYYLDGSYNGYGHDEWEYDYKTTCSFKTLALLRWNTKLLKYEVLYIISPTKGRKKNLNNTIKSYKDSKNSELYKEGFIQNYSNLSNKKEVITFGEFLNETNIFWKETEAARLTEIKKQQVLEQKNNIPKGYDKIFEN